MGAYTHITLNQRQEVAYCHSYPHLVPLGANLRFGLAKIEDHGYGYHENDKGTAPATRMMILRKTFHQSGRVVLFPSPHFESQ